MATKIDQKAYLQKYLSGSSGDKKKKKKKVTKGRGFKIIDDDLDLSKLKPLEGDDIDILGEGEDAPQIAGIIDERPDEIKKLEQFKTTSKWRVISEDDGFNSKLQIQEVKKDIKEVEKENELIFGKMYSDSEDEQKQNSDLSPPRKQSSNDQQAENKTSKKPLNHSDSDFSPPRKKNVKNHRKSHSKNSDSDISPPRKNYKHERKEIKSKRIEEDDDSDLSPPRKNGKHERKELKSKRVEEDDDSDLSPPRKNGRHERKDLKSKRIEEDNDFDLSPPRKNSKSNDKVRKHSRWGDFKEEQERYIKRCKQKSPPLYQRLSRSPDRHKTKNVRSNSLDSDISPPRKTQRNNNKAYDSDLSPPRKSKKVDTRKRNTSPGSDGSPSRKGKYSPQRQQDSRNRSYKKYNSDGSSKYNNSNKYSDKNDINSDRSRYLRDEARRSSKERDYNRKLIDRSEYSPSRNRGKINNKRRHDRNSDSPPPTNKKMEKTLEGKKAGLQDAVELRQENEAFRKREEEAFSKMTDETSGRNAQVVSRKGKRETSEERRKQKEKVDKQKELDEKYKRWGKGLKQLEDQEKRVQEFMHESSKPLARHKGDRDLEDRLKDIEREGDPMLKYIREKKRDRGELGPEKPSYKGNFPPNRFNIPPGYRWDGVDRSNGYEKKFFDQQSKRKAQAEEAYKWSTEDL